MLNRGIERISTAVAIKLQRAGFRAYPLDATDYRPTAHPEKLHYAVAAADEAGEKLPKLGFEIIDVFSHRFAAAHAGLGFFETRTSDKLAAALGELGLDVTRGLARTGLRTDMAGGADGPKVAVIGELDGIVCRQHPLAVEDTGASHACGHNLQISAVYAMAAALAKTGLMKELAGSVAFLGLPAEEFIEVGRRTEMRERGGPV